eukprot:Tbor_TRINITY_DN5809_c7_g1::TRINITY_DN5809_c7_g1_i1::g.7077::m.7077
MITIPKQPMSLTSWLLSMILLLLLLAQQHAHTSMALPSKSVYSCEPTEYPYGCTLVNNGENNNDNSIDGIVGEKASFRECKAFEVSPSTGKFSESNIYILDRNKVREYIHAERKLITLDGTIGESDKEHNVSMIDLTRSGDYIYLIASITTVNSYNYFIRKIPIDLSPAQTIYTGNDFLYPTSITAHNGKIYVTNSALNSIDTIDLTTGEYKKGETLNEGTNLNIPIAPDSFVIASDELAFMVTKTRKLHMINLKTNAAVMITNPALYTSSVLQSPICLDRKHQMLFFIMKKTDVVSGLYTLYSMSYANIDTSRPDQNIREWLSYSGAQKDGPNPSFSEPRAIYAVSSRKLYYLEASSIRVIYLESSPTMTPTISATLTLNVSQRGNVSKSINPPREYPYGKRRTSESKRFCEDIGCYAPMLSVLVLLLICIIILLILLYCWYDKIWERVRDMFLLYPIMF